MHFILFYFTFTSFKVIFEEPLPHPPSLHGDHHYSTCKRDDHTIPSTGTQATTPMLHPSLAPTPTAAIAPFAGMQVMFFSFLFFHPFSDQCYRDSLYPMHRVPQNPASPHIIPTTVLCPSSLPSPPAAIACIRGHTSKAMFSFSFFHFFSDQCCRDLFFPHAGSSNPHLSTVPHPSSLTSPAATIASFAGM